MLPLLLLLVLGSLWGSTPALGKIAALAGVTPFGYALWQSLGAGILLLGICSLRGSLPRITRRHAAFYLFCGGVGIALPVANLLLVLPHLPSGVVSVVITTAPLATYAISLGLGMERASVSRAAGILCGLGGTLLIMLPASSLPAPGMTGWAAVALLTPLCYAVSNVGSARWRPPDSDSLSLACGMLWGAVVLLVPATLLTGTFHVFAIPLGPGEWALLGHIAISAMAFILFFEILRLAGPVYLSQVGYIVTLSGVAWGIYLFDERHSAWIWGGVALIFAGLALVNLRSAPR